MKVPFNVWMEELVAYSEEKKIYDIGEIEALGKNFWHIYYLDNFEPKEAIREAHILEEEAEWKFDL